MKRVAKPKPRTPGRKPRDGSAAIERLVIRLTADEIARVRSAAGEQSVAAWARARLLERAS